MLPANSEIWTLHLFILWIDNIYINFTLSLDQGLILLQFYNGRESSSNNAKPMSLQQWWISHP